MTERQKKMAARAYAAGQRARVKGIGYTKSGLRDYQATDRYAAAVAITVGSYPGYERDDVLEAFHNGWEDEDYRLHLRRTDPRGYAHAYGT